MAAASLARQLAKRSNLLRGWILTKGRRPASSQRIEGSSERRSASTTAAGVERGSSTRKSSSSGVRHLPHHGGGQARHEAQTVRGTQRYLVDLTLHRAGVDRLSLGHPDAGFSGLRGVVRVLPEASPDLPLVVARSNVDT